MAILQIMQMNFIKLFVTETCWIKIVLFSSFSSRLPYTTPLYALACKVLVRTKIFFLLGIFEYLICFCAELHVFY